MRHTTTWNRSEWVFLFLQKTFPIFDAIFKIFVSYLEMTVRKYYNTNMLLIMAMQHFLLLLAVVSLVDADSVLNKKVSFRKKRQAEEENPIVGTQYGPVRGFTLQDAQNNSFFAFLGIPYAKPPVGPLRFKDAQPPDPWGEEIRDALTEGSICPQPNADSLTDIVGDEDCLFLNVYTPRLPLSTDSLLPVMFWIHGGAFIGGSGNSYVYGPNYLLMEDIIVVTINYRLGPLGFLYLRESAPGNAAMKDQVAALRWVQRNIAAFGGDPTKVTVFGESAGGASVHLLLLSPMSRGLFHAAISLSGNALNGWVVNKKLYAKSLNLTKAVGCPTSSSSALQCMQNTSIQELLYNAYKPVQLDAVREVLLEIPFTPTVDFPAQGVETFLREPPIQLVSEGRYLHVPYLLGFSSNESALFYTSIDILNESTQEALNNYTYAILLPELLRLCENEISNGKALEAIRKFYMNGEPLNNSTIRNYLTMITDVFFGEGVFYTIRHMAKYHYSRLYQYSFTINDALNTISSTSERHYLGASHGDILGYLFRRGYIPDVPVNSTAYISRQRMVRMWTNFAKYRNPTPFNDPLLNVRWKPYTKYSRNYLNIGTELSPGKDLNRWRALFWERFYRHFECHMYFK